MPNSQTKQQLNTQRVNLRQLTGSEEEIKKCIFCFSYKVP